MEAIKIKFKMLLWSTKIRGYLNKIFDYFYVFTLKSDCIYFHRFPSI